MASYVTTNTRVGANTGGTPFDTFTEHGITAGAFIKSVIFYSSGRNIVGFTLTYTDGVTVSHGNTQGAENISPSYSINEGDTITECTLWGDGNGTNLGSVSFTTSSGAKIDYGSGKGKEGFSQSIGSGIIAAFTGTATPSTILSLAVQFLDPIQSIKCSHYQYQLPPPGQGISLQGRDWSPFVNEDYHQTRTMHFASKQDVTSKHIVAKTTTNAVTAGLSIMVSYEVSIPEIVKVSASATASLQYEHSSAVSTTTETDKSIENDITGDVKVPPRHKVYCRAAWWEGSCQGSYTCHTTMIFHGGASVTYPETSTFTNVAFTKGEMAIGKSEPIGEEGHGKGEGENGHAKTRNGDDGKHEHSDHDHNQPEHDTNGHDKPERSDHAHDKPEHDKNGHADHEHGENGKPDHDKPERPNGDQDKPEHDKNGHQDHEHGQHERKEPEHEHPEHGHGEAVPAH